MFKIRLYLTALCLIVSASSARFCRAQNVEKDRLYLKSGDSIIGTIIEEEFGKSVTVEISPGHNVIYKADELERIVRARAKVDASPDSTMISMGSIASDTLHWWSAPLKRIAIGFGPEVFPNGAPSFSSVRLLLGPNLKASAFQGVAAVVEWPNDTEVWQAASFYPDYHFYLADARVRPYLFVDPGVMILSSSSPGSGLPIGIYIGCFADAGIGVSVPLGEVASFYVESGYRALIFPWQSVLVRTVNPRAGLSFAW